MDEIQWKRLMHDDLSPSSQTEQVDLVNQLKRRRTFIKYKSNGRSYSRVYYLILSEDAIHYCGSRRKSNRKACLINDIEQIREGFTTNTWKKCLEKRKVAADQLDLAFSILYNNNRNSLDLLAESTQIRSQWIKGLEFLINRYRSHIRSHREITDQWIWRLFSRADADQSGQLSRREVHHLLRTLNIQLDDRDIDFYFSCANVRTQKYEELTHLDKDEFLTFYKYISQRPELSKIICQFNGSTTEEMAAVLSEYSTLGKLPNLSPLERLRQSHSLNFNKLKAPKMKDVAPRLCRSRSTSVTPDVNLSPENAVEKKNYLTIEQLKDFLQNEEQMKTVSIEDCAKLIVRFEPSTEGQHCEEMGVDGLRLLLLHDEFCLMNPDKAHRIYHDMTRPITDYFIATSHNTYIRDNQVAGDCTAETYIHALRTGCRAVEMDCYDGDLGEPVVYHGHTLTVPIPLREILVAIDSQAFVDSPYPIFLNVENHCSYVQQGVMGRLLKEIFKDHLLSKPLVDEFQSLPSPEQLKHRVLVRSRRSFKGNLSADAIQDENEPNTKSIHPDFANLMVYSQIVSFTNILQTVSTQKCFHTISLKESKANELIQANGSEHLDLIQLTQHHLIRVYPGSARQNSSNVHPPIYWPYGIQMVALNYQAKDESMCLQQGFFSDNGGCGYLLKPACLLATDLSFDPKERFYEKGKRLHLHLISGQHLPKQKDAIEHPDIVDPYVKIYTYGVEGDYTEHRSPSVRNNGLNPMWDYRMTAEIHRPELCLLMVEVRDEDRYGRSSFIGQACVPFHALQLGYRHIKLRAKNGDFTRGTLFVHVKIDDF